jgi:hypothetical protein
VSHGYAFGLRLCVCVRVCMYVCVRVFCFVCACLSVCVSMSVDVRVCDDRALGTDVTLFVRRKEGFLAGFDVRTFLLHPY